MMRIYAIMHISWYLCNTSLLHDGVYYHQPAWGQCWCSISLRVDAELPAKWDPALDENPDPLVCLPRIKDLHGYLQKEVEEKLYYKQLAQQQIDRAMHYASSIAGSLHLASGLTNQFQVEQARLSRLMVRA